jgi:hypothetical protein
VSAREAAARLLELIDEMNRPPAPEQRQALVDEYMNLIAKHPDAHELAYRWQLARISELTGQDADAWETEVSAAVEAATSGLLGGER